MSTYLTPRRRRWIYGIAIAAAALLTAYGKIPVEVAPLWLALIVAILNVQDGDA